MTTRFNLITHICTTMLLALAPALAQQNNHASPIMPAGGQHIPDVQGAQQALDKQAPVFIENKGQWDKQAKFLLRSNGLDLWITDRGVVYDINRVEQVDARSSTATIASTSAGESKPIVHRTAVFVTFLGAHADAVSHGSERAEGYHNYFIGNDPSKWAANVPLYSGARIEKLYTGIDAVFYLDEGRPRYDLVLAPGADASQVQMQFQGAEKVGIDGNGSLVITTSLGEVRQQELYAYQMRDGKQEQVGCGFRRGKDGVVRFDVGSYDRSRPLVIDPVVIAYSTYLGGSDGDQGFGIAVDGSGNAYTAGYTQSTNFPTLNPAQSSLAGTPDVFVTKLTSAGALSYSTYLGGSDNDEGFGIGIDGSGNAYITGHTNSTNFPTLNPAQSSNAGGLDAFVTKLTSAGALSYSTYLGGSDNDEGFGIGADGSGNAYITGVTQSTNFLTLNPAQSSNAGSSDAFVTKLTSVGALSYSTYLGGSSVEQGTGIAVDGSGNAYITGVSASTNFPTLNPAQSSNAGVFDAFVTKLTSVGALSYSTYLGGSSSDLSQGVAVDGSGNTYITGVTQSTNFPTLNPAQPSNAGNGDAFVTKLTSVGALSYSTYLGGGSGSDQGRDIEVDGSGNAYITGYTQSTNFPTLNPAQLSNAGSFDAFVTKLTSAGALSYSTYLGGSSLDQSRGIGVDGSGNAYIAGQTNSTNFPTLNAAQSSFGGSGDAFVTKLSFPQDAILPVELTGFTLSSSNSSVTIAWRTASEVNNAGFEVQRSSESDTTLAPIASYLNHPDLVGLGTTSQGKSYALVDANLAPGLYGYRLVDVSTDGIRTAHEAKTIRVEDAGTIDVNFLHLNAVTPNPVKNDMQISYSLPEAMAVTMEVYTSDGRLVATPIKAESHVAGSNSQSISVADLTPGVYTLRLVAGGSSRTQRFIVVR